ncbi:MAG: hypothetical protein PWQ37_3082 [Candidatus Petromonas sp.]|nr:hypothetical protein [Candidatus Petromonas sp.]
MIKKIFIMFSIIILLVAGWYFFSKDEDVESKLSINNEQSQTVSNEEKTSDDSSKENTAKAEVDNSNRDTDINKNTGNDDSDEDKVISNEEDNYIEETESKKDRDNDVKEQTGEKVENMLTHKSSGEQEESLNLTSEEIEGKITQKYTVLFTNLRKKYEAKINDLIAQAKNEYFSLPEEERDAAKLKLGLKYLKLGKALEEECDKEFYALLDNMKAELKENNLGKDAANKAEKIYKEEKSERRKTLLSKAMKIKND